MNLFDKTRILIPLVFLTGLSASCSDNEVEYYGILDHRPEGKDGMWVIDGKSFSVTDEVELDEDHGPITVSDCVELEMEEGDVKEIESVEIGKCQAEQK
jgi:hypothetical protein